MLSALIAHIIITLSCLVGGIVFYSLFPQKGQSRPVFYLISGLIVFTACTQVIAIFYPIHLRTQLCVSIILLLFVAIKWQTHKNLLKKIGNDFLSWPVLLRLLFFIVWLIILLINAGPIIMDDTESYHIQSIKWIREYGSVPGLVNLHERFGFNSSWFSSVALFQWPGGTENFTSLNGVLSMWFCYWLISRYREERQQNHHHGAFSFLVVFICCLIAWPLFRGNTASTNYDFITTFIVFILFAEIYLTKSLSPSLEWIIWPVYLFTIRIINFPLLLLPVVALIVFIKQKNYKPVVVPVVFCFLLIVPFIIRNVIITGYPFYPSTSFDFTSVDWKPDPQMTERLLEYIKYYNRVSTTHLEIEQTRALGSNWIPSWFTYLFRFDKLLVVSGLIGIVLSIAKLFTQKNKTVILLITISVIWLICWFIISPDPRFVYGILLFGIFLLAYNFISVIKQVRLVHATGNALVIAIIIALSYYFIAKLWKQPSYRNWLSLSRLPRPPVREIIIDGITFRIPEPINNNWNARCYGTELPCLYKIDPRLKPRGKNTADGFRLEK